MFMLYIYIHIEEFVDAASISKSRNDVSPEHKGNADKAEQIGPEEQVDWVQGLRRHFVRLAGARHSHLAGFLKHYIHYGLGYLELHFRKL